SASSGTTRHHGGGHPSGLPALPAAKVATFAAQPAGAQGQLVLESSRPALATDANDQGWPGASRNDAARAATAIASTASPNDVAVGTSTASIGSRSCASTVNHTRIASPLDAN